MPWRLEDTYISPFLFLFWSCWQISRLDIPMLDADVDELRPLMSAESCSFAVDVSEEPIFGNVAELLIRRSGWSFMLEKFNFLLYQASDMNKFSGWLLSQLFTLHFFEEMIICEKFLIALVVLAVLNTAIYFMTSDPLVPNGKNPHTVGPSHEVRFFPEKFIILTSVIVRSPESSAKERHLSFARFNGSASCVLSDITIFALWYAILSSISLAVRRLTYRLEEAVLPGRHSFSEWASVPFLKTIFLLFAVFCTSVTLLSMTVTSYRLVHPLYAAVFIIESIEVLLKSCYCLVLFLHAYLQQRERDQSPRQRFMWFMNKVTHHSISLSRYLLYIYIGGFVNDKIIPLSFATPAVLHLNGLIDTFTSSPSLVQY